MSDHKARDLTNAIIATLRAEGLLVGDGDAPVGGGWQGATGVFKPYVNVHSTAGGAFDGPLGDPFTFAAVDYTTVSIGATREMSELLADQVHAVLVAAVFTLSGRTVLQIRPMFAPGAFREDDVQQPLWSAAERWRITTA